MKRYYACVNDCGYKTGPYHDDYDAHVADPNHHWQCYNCPEETYTDAEGNQIQRRPMLKPAHVYNKRELQKMKADEMRALGLPPGGPRLRVQKAEKFGAGILDVE